MYHFDFGNPSNAAGQAAAQAVANQSRPQAPQGATPNGSEPYQVMFANLTNMYMTQASYYHQMALESMKEHAATERTIIGKQLQENIAQIQQAHEDARKNLDSWTTLTNTQLTQGATTQRELALQQMRDAIEHEKSVRQAQTSLQTNATTAAGSMINEQMKQGATLPQAKTAAGQTFPLSGINPDFRQNFLDSVAAGNTGVLPSVSSLIDKNTAETTSFIARAGLYGAKTAQTYQDIALKPIELQANLAVKQSQINTATQNLRGPLGIKTWFDPTVENMVNQNLNGIPQGGFTGGQVNPPMGGQVNPPVGGEQVNPPMSRPAPGTLNGGYGQGSGGGSTNSGQGGSGSSSMDAYSPPPGSPSQLVTAYYQGMALNNYYNAIHSQNMHGQLASGYPTSQGIQQNIQTVPMAIRALPAIGNWIQGLTNGLSPEVSSGRVEPGANYLDTVFNHVGNPKYDKQAAIIDQTARSTFARGGFQNQPGFEDVKTADQASQKLLAMNDNPFGNPSGVLRNTGDPQAMQAADIIDQQTRQTWGEAGKQAVVMIATDGLQQAASPIIGNGLKAIAAPLKAMNTDVGLAGIAHPSLQALKGVPALGHILDAAGNGLIARGEVGVLSTARDTLSGFKQGLAGEGTGLIPGLGTPNSGFGQYPKGIINPDNPNVGPEINPNYPTEPGETAPPYNFREYINAKRAEAAANTPPVDTPYSPPTPPPGTVDADFNLNSPNSTSNNPPNPGGFNYGFGPSGPTSNINSSPIPPPVPSPSNPAEMWQQAVQQYGSSSAVPQEIREQILSMRNNPPPVPTGNTPPPPVGNTSLVPTTSGIGFRNTPYNSPNPPPVPTPNSAIPMGPSSIPVLSPPLDIPRSGMATAYSNPPPIPLLEEEPLGDWKSLIKPYTPPLPYHEWAPETGRMSNPNLPINQRFTVPPTQQNMGTPPGGFTAPPTQGVGGYIKQSINNTLPLARIAPKLPLENDPPVDISSLIQKINPNDTNLSGLRQSEVNARPLNPAVKADNDAWEAAIRRYGGNENIPDDVRQQLIRNSNAVSPTPYRTPKGNNIPSSADTPTGPLNGGNQPTGGVPNNSDTGPLTPPPYSGQVPPIQPLNTKPFSYQSNPSSPQGGPLPTPPVGPRAAGYPNLNNMGMPKGGYPNIPPPVPQQTAFQPGGIPSPGQLMRPTELPTPNNPPPVPYSGNMSQMGIPKGGYKFNFGNPDVSPPVVNESITPQAVSNKLLGRPLTPKAAAAMDKQNAAPIPPMEDDPNVHPGLKNILMEGQVPPNSGLNTILGRNVERGNYTPRNLSAIHEKLRYTPMEFQQQVYDGLMQQLGTAPK